MIEVSSIALAILAAIVAIVGVGRVLVWLSDRKGTRGRIRGGAGAPGIVSGESYGKGGLDGGDADGGGGD